MKRINWLLFPKYRKTVLKEIKYYLCTLIEYKDTTPKDLNPEYLPQCLGQLRARVDMYEVLWGELPNLNIN